MRLKMIVEACSYENDYAGEDFNEVTNVTEVIASNTFVVQVVYDEQKKYYVPVDLKQMLRPYVHLIEICVMDNMDYSEIAIQCGMLQEFMKRLDEYEPTHEEYLVDILAKCLYDVGCDKIIPQLGNVMYRLLYTLEEENEI